MKKSLFVCISILAFLTTSQADFSFGEMFKNMKESAISMSNDTKKYIEDNTVKNETNEYSEKDVKNLIRDNKYNLLEKKLLEMQEKNEILNTSLIKSESEKNRFYKYAGFFIGISILLLISLLIFWFLSIRKCKQNRLRR